MGRLLARRIGEGERHRVFLGAAVVLVAAAAGLTLARHPEHATPRAGRTAPPTLSAPSPVTTLATPVTGAIPALGGGQISGTGPPGAMGAGQAFLTSYLRFAYGQAPPRFPDATPALRTRLAGFHVAVSPDQRSRYLSLLALRARHRGGGWEVTALASDGVASFPVAVIVTHQHRRWLAVRLVTVAGG